MWQRPLVPNGVREDAKQNKRNVNCDPFFLAFPDDGMCKMKRRDNLTTIVDKKRPSFLKMNTKKEIENGPN